MFRYIFTVICLLVVSSAAISQELGRIEGKVINSETGEALVAAEIVIQDLNIYDISADDGAFRLQSILRARFIFALDFTFIGCMIHFVKI